MVQNLCNKDYAKGKVSCIWDNCNFQNRFLNISLLINTYLIYGLYLIMHQTKSQFEWFNSPQFLIASFSTNKWSASWEATLIKTVSCRNCKVAYDASSEHQGGTIKYHTECVCAYCDSWKMCWKGNKMSATNLKGSFKRKNQRAELPKCPCLFYFELHMWSL